ncbi:MAG: PD-(D/E)XK nuclease family protein, partial [Planctomycetota bacterium]|nr:PD-(D/E)XK nuclease family protein [Planctomycetota bacterium]
ATQLLDRMLEKDVTIDILIRAPESESLGFDAYGCIDTSCWINREIEINDAAITVSGSPSAQAAAVIRKLEQLGDSVTTDQITISSTDESLIPIIRRHIEGYGINTRFAGGDSVLQKQEAILLSCLATFVSTRSYDSYASLVRHPDIADLLKIEDSVVKKLSKYSMTVIPKQVSHDEWFSPKESREDFSGLQELHKAIFDLLGPCFKQEEKPALIEQSSKVIRAFLLTVYGDESLNIDDPRFKVLQKIFSLIDRLDDLTETISKQLGPLSFSEALSIVLEELSGMSVPALSSIEAIDIVGWLEAIATESPHLIVVGMSADLIGGNDPSDTFFPDGLREALGLETINRRMARDAHAIIAMQHAHSSNGSVDWIVGRKNMDGDPLNASPLLMRCSDSEQLAKRSGELVISMERENPEVPPQFKRLSEGSGLAFPNPKEFQLEKVRKLSVTAFKDFIACPYRFWLKHILKLNLAEEGSSELDAKLFGTFVHAVLQRFGENTSVRNSTDVKEIETLLLAELDQLAKEQLGAGISGKVRVQLELAKYRLRLFAAHQAESSAEGWKIVCTERKANTVLEVGGSPFKISGIIDRIDVHEDGRIRVLDYKTGATSANNMHFKKTSGQWVDYQLPLYRRLLSEIKELDNYDTTNNNISLGYFKISDQESTSGVDLLALPEAAMESVDDQIEMTITSILEGEFTERPTEPAPKYSDTFSWICQDNSVTEQSYND